MLAHGVLDEVAAEVPVDLQEVTQVPCDLTVGQATEPEVSLVRVRKDTVQLFQHLGHEDFAIRDAGLNGFFGGHVAPLEIVQGFLPMLGILQPEIGELQEIDPALFLFRIVALRTVGLEERRDGGCFSEMGSSFFGRAFAKDQPRGRNKGKGNYFSQLHALIYKERCRFPASQSLVV